MKTDYSSAGETSTLDEKLKNLQEIIKKMDKTAIAFSGGVDSTFLLKVAYDLLKSDLIAITVKTQFCLNEDLTRAINVAKRIGVEHVLISAHLENVQEIMTNSLNRCYYCKDTIISKIFEEINPRGIENLIDGSNVDDANDYRPGTEVLKKFGVRSPLEEVGLTKQNIRKLSRKMGLETWDKSSSACLATRIPYGEPITQEKLNMISGAERYLHSLGFKQVRVRVHGTLARIEVSQYEREKFFDEELMDEVSEVFKVIGFTYIALDLMGYRMGSFNELILVN